MEHKTTSTENKDNIQVYIRIKPTMSQSRLQTDSQTLKIKEKQYNFDKCFDQDANQSYIYQHFGKRIISSFFQGYNNTIFAYGQTGSGKSYTMIGDDSKRENIGIVPRLIEDILNEYSTSERKLILNFGMVEIYNEKIQDLLIPYQDRTLQGLKIREHTQLGIFLEGQTKHQVKSIEEINILMKKGFRNRSISSTNMNDQSSRAHTIINIELIQCNGREKKDQRDIQSNLYLVDLAGSEKIDKTGVKGDRLIEACNINTSLSTLGLVISILSDKAQGKQKNTVVPFRNSQLTRLLQNALGGNSNTIMICTISQEQSNMNETISTLRYAEQAKKIKNHAKINETDSDKIIRELQQENQQLKQLLKSLKTVGNNMDKLSKIQDDIQVNEEILNEFEARQKNNGFKAIKRQKSFEQQIIVKNLSQWKLQQINEEKRFILYNLDVNEELNGRSCLLIYDNMTIGKKNSDNIHCVFHIKDDVVSIQNIVGSVIYINGVRIQGDQQINLLNDDRISLNEDIIYVLREQGQPNQYVNLLMAQEEISGELDQDVRFLYENLVRDIDENIKLYQQKLGKYKNEMMEIHNKSEQEKEEYKEQIMQINEQLEQIVKTKKI